MSEIKFACPHCAQHIACASDYADMCIVCPGCGKPMMVPILSATEAAHPHLYLVAAAPAPRQKFRSRIPTLDPWTEEAWERHAAESPNRGFTQPVSWLVPILMLLPVVTLLALGAERMSGNFIMPFGMVCSTFAAWLTVWKVESGVITRWLTGIFVAAGFMVLQLGILGFAGCCAVGLVD